MSYYGATICLGGHVISSHDANLVKYCTECGKPTFSKCPACHAGQFLKDSLYQLLVDVMSETVKNAICG